MTKTLKIEYFSLNSVFYSKLSRLNGPSFSLTPHVIHVRSVLSERKCAILLPFLQRASIFRAKEK